jgi:hypothetical protein
MKITSFALTALFLVGIASHSQTIKPKITFAKQSTYEIGGDIMMYSSEYVYENTIYTLGGSTTITTFQLNGSFGYFVMDHLKLSVEPAISHSVYGDNSSTNLKLYFSPEYVFITKSEVFPFIGGSVGYTSSSYAHSNAQGGFSWGFKGGIKVNALGNALINMGFSYYRETYNYTASYGDVKQHYNIFGIKAGLSVFFP